MPSWPSRLAMNSGNDSKDQGIAASEPGAMSSTRAKIWVMNSRSSTFAGAIEKPQLPVRTVVTPWKHDDVP